MDIACMSNQDETETATEQNQPKKLYKPRREDGELNAEQVITYTTECDTSTHTPAY